MTIRLAMLFDALRQRGLKLTSARKVILQCLAANPSHLITALDLFDQVRAKNKRVNFSTVYRNLEILTDCGLVQKINFEGSAKYQLCDEEKHHHHLICTACNKTAALPYCPLGNLEETVIEKTDFLPIDHVVEIYGYCKECRARKGC